VDAISKPQRTELSGRAVLITGAGDGLGRAYALDIARHGAAVLVNDVNADTANAVVEEIRAAGGAAEVDVRPIGTAEAGEATVEACVKAFGKIDGLITNAGIFTQALPTDMPSERAEQIIRTNLMGVIHNGVAALRHMQKAGRGAIVNIVSASMFGIPEISVYGASKGGVLTLTYAWAKACAGTGIHVHGLSPFAMTTMMKQSTAQFHSGSQPEDIAPLATFLISDKAAPLNGKIIRLTANKLHVLTPAEFGPPLGEQEDWDIDSIGEALKGSVDA